MDSITTPSTCLNCDAELQGPFCSQCGQRAIPRYPSVPEMAGDAWHEVSGWDGRFLRTFRRLLLAPGDLTIEVLEGRRARYVSPVRLYLVASVLYFVVAAAAPNLRLSRAAVLPNSNVTIDLRNPEATPLPPERRDEILASVERAPWVLRPMLRSAILEPVAFRGRFLENLPRMFFVLVPVFAAILSTVFRRRPFSQHLTLALHVHAVVFVTQAIREAFNFTGSGIALGVAELTVFIFMLRYALVALRRVYAESWPRTLAKAAAIAVAYGLAAFVALMLTLAWVSVT